MEIGQKMADQVEFRDIRQKIALAHVVRSHGSHSFLLNTGQRQLALAVKPNDRLATANAALVCCGPEVLCNSVPPAVRAPSRSPPSSGCIDDWIS